jgi:transcriptional regulator with XRE-family HTH domain
MPDEHKINAVKHMSSGRSLKELALHLGLSQTTVSRVINNSGNTHRISAATQKRVLAAAAEMNYKASPLARGLRSRRSQTIGVMVPEISGGYSAAVLSGIEDVLLLRALLRWTLRWMLSCRCRLWRCRDIYGRRRF